MPQGGNQIPIHLRIMGVAMATTLCSCKLRMMPQSL